MKRLTVCCCLLFALPTLFAAAEKNRSVQHGVTHHYDSALPIGVQDVFNLRDYGAIGDGITDDGPALQRALSALAQAGGGTLFVPQGRYAIITSVSQDFTGLDATVVIQGVASSAVVPPPNSNGLELTRGLSLVSEFAPKTGAQQLCIKITGLRSFLMKDIGFIGTPNILTDAWITLDLEDIWEARIQHCEFYGLSSQVAGGAIVRAVRSDLTIEQTEFLGSFCNSGQYTSVVQNVEWKGITVTETIFADYGQRPELYSKSSSATLSWVNIGNAAAPQSDSPRREAVFRNVFLDEGGYFGLTSLSYLYLPPSARIDLVYITGLYMNVSNFGTTGHYLWDLDRVLIEKSHYGWSHNAESALHFLGVGNAIVDNVECVAASNRILANSVTEKLTVINSVYTALDSLAQTTKVINTTPEEDPVQFVRQAFMDKLDRDPDPAAHFYWSDRILQCGDNAQCVTAERAALAGYLNAAPAKKFSITGQITDEGNESLAGVTITLTGSQSTQTQTDSNGRYSFSGLPTSGVYTLTPTRVNYAFTASTQTITTPNGDQTVNFAATLNRYTLSGRVLNAAGQGISGATVSLSGSQAATVTTDSSGACSFTVLAEGNYTITASRTNYTVSPAVSFNDLGSNRTANFTGTLVSYTLSGRVLNAAGQGISGATVSLSGSQTATVTTDSSGAYSFTVLAEGNYTITASRANYTVSPAVSFNDLGSNRTANFTGTLVSYTLSGRVVNAAGQGISGATVSLSGSQTATVTTDSSGAYSFTVLAEGNYTITASRTNHTLTPPASFNNLGSNRTANFTGTLVSYTLSGRVTNDGEAFSGVTLNLSGAQSANVISGTDGKWSFVVPAEGDYTVTPSLNHHTFSTQQATFRFLSANQNVDFQATLNRHTISGRVTKADGSGFPGTTMTLTGAQTATTTTDASGNYAFANLPAGRDYVVAPSRSNYAFAPATANFNDLSTDQTLNVTGGLVSYTLSGRISGSGKELGGVTVTLTGSDSAAAITDVKGHYSFKVPAEGNYTITPAKTNYLFSPASTTFNLLSADHAADFDGALQRLLEFSEASFSASETARTIAVTVTRTGDTSEAAEVIYSAGDGSAQQRGDVIPIIGKLSFQTGETSKSFIILITDDTYVEGDESLTLRLTDPVGDTLDTNSTATLTIVDNDTNAAAPNAIDDAQFFVRQHYRDFLNRRADEEGLAFWSNQILSCGTDTACIADRRMNVSAAFFHSIEFQDTGFLVYRLYQAAYAQPPQHLEEFLLDTRTVAEGITVGTPGWQELLAANKASFIKGFVERPPFETAYPSQLRPIEFVNQLNSTAGNVLSANEVSAAVAEFGGAPTSENIDARARVLLRVAENQSFSQRQMNPAFVLMQYFGYLQRNPHELPDTNLDGYTFWLQKLESFGGDFRRAEMVKAFLLSAEYRSRFGTP